MSSSKRNLFPSFYLVQFRCMVEGPRLSISKVMTIFESTMVLEKLGVVGPGVPDLRLWS